MKNIQYLILLVYLTTSLFACSDKEEDQVVPEVELLNVEVST